MNEYKLWYSRPASGWSQGLPIGNGRLGAVIYGGVEEETWSITEVTYLVREIGIDSRSIQRESGS